MAEHTRTALVTGATRGIGRATALALADAGFDVAVTGRTLTEGTGTIAALARIAGVINSEYRDRGVRAYNLDPGFVVAESRTARGGVEAITGHGPAPDTPELPAAAIAWLVSEAGAAHPVGRPVVAQRLRDSGVLAHKQ